MKEHLPRHSWRSHPGDKEPGARVSPLKGLGDIPLVELQHVESEHETGG